MQELKDIQDENLSSIESEVSEDDASDTDDE